MLRIRPKADLVYGASKTRKTTQIGLIANYVWKKYHKRTRLISADGGGYDPILGDVNRGLIIPWVPIARPGFTISTIDFACQGWWPKDPEDPKSPLVPPTPEVWEDIGFVAIEGLTGIGDMMIRQLKHDKAHLSQDPSYSYAEAPVEVEVNGRAEKRVITYSGGNQSYYGQVQDNLWDFVIKSHLLPCEKVLWTALEGKGEEEGSRAPTYGPAIAGKKSIGKAPQWFGNCLHIEQLTTRKVDPGTNQPIMEERPILYLRPHADPLSNIPFPAGTRAPYQFASELPICLDPPDMGRLYTLLDVLTERASQLDKVEQPSPPTSSSQAVPAMPEAAKKFEAVDAKVEVVAAGPSTTLSEVAMAHHTPPAQPLTPQPLGAFVPPRISVKRPITSK